jgi:hypothetical protein
MRLVSIDCHMQINLGAKHLDLLQLSWILEGVF